MLPHNLPTNRFGIGSKGNPGKFITLEIPNAISMTSGSSTSMCPTEIMRPDFAPPLVPCRRFAAKSGPGARAPEAVTTTTVARNAGKLGESCTFSPAPPCRPSMDDLCIAAAYFRIENYANTFTQSVRDKKSGASTGRCHVLRRLRFSDLDRGDRALNLTSATEDTVLLPGWVCLLGR